MCGILGGISCERFDFLATDDALNAALDRLAHRGPDDSGRYVSADRRAFLGHRRLSIIGLADGRQPIADEAGVRHLSHNGEVYNYKAIRKSLVSRGHVMRTRTDGEVALHLYEENPDSFVEALHGMFAIAILDETSHALTLVRDRNGIKPLFYYCDGRRLIFASEIKAILALLPNVPAICPDALRQFLRWKYVPAPLTIYEGIRKLPAAHLLRAERNETTGRLDLSVRGYWDVDYSGPKIADEAEALDALDRKLRCAVESHLESDVEVGALLSGGVDSSLVVALAAEVSGRRMKTFCVGFREVGFDQLPFARRLAQKYDTEHFEEQVAFDPMATVPQLVRQFDEPFADSSALACLRVCQVAAEHVKVVLTGDGGDESFAGYGRYDEILNPVAGGFGRRLLSRSILASSGFLFTPEAKYLKRFRAALRSPLEQHEEHQVMYSRYVTDRLLGENYRSGGDSSDIFDQHRRWGLQHDWAPLEIAQYVDLRMYLPGDILTKVDRTSMACSLECRVPLLDHSITEFAAGLAPDLKIRDGIRKYLLKKLAERYVPRELLYRPKMGFRVPIRRWFKRGLLDQTASLLLDGVLVERGVLDSAGVRWMLRHQRRPWIDFSSHLWALLNLEHWARAYLA